ncbi:Putative Globin-sensor domain-containing protein [Septoria linicola]|uniref:Globin-sensor domain-containing protein n=1 Tax=Septoria linicola TaxID=215465 RepID=A0A9Q9AYM7_9PEZI|nr:putative Globin-sensor domain-containing protein [Septoria linicola]USW57530.1 Putative Globin-sensor domain-containing protein [Septoria linicola]
MASLPNSMEHVDRRELLTSLPARIHYLHQFLEFGSDDVEALIDGQKYIKMVIPAIVNMVYKKLLKHDITARVFSNRDSRNEEDPDVWVKEESSTIQNRKMFLRWYLTKLNSDPTKFEYWEYLDKVGLMHVGQGRRNPLHVDYIFLGACLGYIQDSMMEAILYHPKLSMRRKVAIVKAVTKIIWIQNDLLAKWHTMDGVEYAEQLRAEEQEQLTESGDQESYLNGHKVLDGEDETCSGSTSTASSSNSHGTPLGTVHEDSSSTHTTSTTSSGGKTSLGRSIEDIEVREMRCPFSGMAVEQRAEMTRPTLKTILDEKTTGHVVNTMKRSGIPKLHLVDGKTVCKEKLEREPWGREEGGDGGRSGGVGQAL